MIMCTWKWLENVIQSCFLYFPLSYRARFVANLCNLSWRHVLEVFERNDLHKSPEL